MAKGSYCHAKGSNLFTGEVGGPIRTTGLYSTVRYKFNDAAQLPLTLIGWDFFARSPSENRNHVARVASVAARFPP